MVCIYCSSNTQVTNSRSQKKLNQVWRRRQCMQCRSIFTTHELTDLSTSLAVSYSPTDLRPFVRELLFMSIYESCKHRPQAIYDATHISQTVIAKVFTTLSQADNGVITRDTLVEICAATLEAFDSAAATMYGAYHPVVK